jgi:hypothetical protein
MIATINDAARETVQSLLDRWWDDESQLAAECEASLVALDETLRELDGWGDRFAREQVTREAAGRLRDADRAAADEHRRRLEHDLAIARARVHDLERALQERTEELLRAQASNNALSAELQSMIDAWPLTEGLPPGSDAWGSESERALLGLGSGPGDGASLGSLPAIDPLASIESSPTIADPPAITDLLEAITSEPPAAAPVASGPGPSATSKFARLRAKRGPSGEAA